MSLKNPLNKSFTKSSMPGKEAKRIEPEIPGKEPKLIGPDMSGVMKNGTIEPRQTSKPRPKFTF